MDKAAGGRWSAGVGLAFMALFLLTQLLFSVPPRSGLPVSLSPLGHPGMELSITSLSSACTLIMAYASRSSPSGPPMYFQELPFKVRKKRTSFISPFISVETVLILFHTMWIILMYGAVLDGKEWAEKATKTASYFESICCGLYTWWNVFGGELFLAHFRLLVKSLNIYKAPTVCQMLC